MITKKQLNAAYSDYRFIELALEIEGDTDNVYRATEYMRGYHGEKLWNACMKMRCDYLWVPFRTDFQMKKGGAK